MKRCQRTRVTVISIHFRISLCDFEVAFVGHLVKSRLAAAKELAGIAVAEVEGLARVDRDGKGKIQSIGE